MQCSVSRGKTYTKRELYMHPLEHKWKETYMHSFIIMKRDLYTHSCVQKKRDLCICSTESVMRVCNPACQKRQAHMKRRSRCMWMQTSQKNRIAERDQYTCGKRPILMWKETNSRKRPIHMWKETNTHVKRDAYNTCVKFMRACDTAFANAHDTCKALGCVCARCSFGWRSLLTCVLVSFQMCNGLCPHVYWSLSTNSQKRPSRYRSCIYIHTYRYRFGARCSHGVATVSRIDEIKGLFCRKMSLL